jgi:hypothetical protein
MHEKCVEPGGQSAGTKPTLSARCGQLREAPHHASRVWRLQSAVPWLYDALSGVSRRVLVLVNLLPCQFAFRGGGAGRYVGGFGRGPRGWRLMPL